MSISQMFMYIGEDMKGSHRPSRRIVLPNGMWLLLYDDDGSMKIAGYDRQLRVTEVLNRDGGAHVFISVKSDGDAPRGVSPRADDLVTVERGIAAAIQRAASAAKLLTGV